MNVLDTATALYFLGAAIGVVSVSAAIGIAIDLVIAGGRDRQAIAVGLMLGVALVVMVGAWTGVQFDLVHDARRFLG